MLRIGVVMYQTSATKGQELVAQRMVKEFRKLGHDAFLITSAYHDAEPVVSVEELKRKGGYVHMFDRELGIPVIRVSSDGTTWPPRRISFVDFVSVLTSIVDDLKLNVLITHSTLWNGPEEVVKFVAWRRKMTDGGAPRAPLVYCHMSHFQEASNERYEITERSFREAWNRVILPQVLREADLVLVTTPFEANLMKRLGADNEKIFLFPGGIDDEDIISLGDEASFREKYSLPSTLKLVSFLGTVEERKNPLGLLEVGKLIKDRGDVKIVIAGRTEGDYAKRVMEEAGDTPNVLVLGAIADEEKAALVRTSMANINMSRSESLGIAQLEFMSYGVPVITSGVGGQSWIVKDGINGIIVDGPDDAQGAAKAIKDIADHPDLQAKLGGAAKRSAAPYSLTRLTDSLSARLEREMRKHSDDMPGLKDMPSDERVIEAWVHNGQRVAATSKRLVVRSTKSGDVTSVPYNAISKIIPHAEAPWGVLIIGALASLFLVEDRVVGLGLLQAMQPGVAAALGQVGMAGATGSVLNLSAFIPLVVCATIFLHALKRGFVVQYGSSHRLFLPSKFGKALRLADKLTPKDLFEAEDQGLDQTTTLA